MFLCRRKIISGIFQTQSSRFCSQTAAFPILSFAEVKKVIQSDKVVLLDVREKGELTSDGKIAQGKNVPLGEVTTAFNMDETSFKENYGFSKPKSDQNIVIHCKAGVRAQSAAKALSQLGFNNIKVYSGINDWKENGGSIS